MPVLAELTPMVLKRLQLTGDVLDSFDNDLEQWLSYLSIDQPWLDASENLANRAMFLRASSAVRDAILESETAATSNSYPTWLERLVISWCATGATVVTFNYDLLIERVVTELQLTQSWVDLYRVPLSDRSTNLIAGMTFGIGAPPGKTLGLIKLHGSINWGYSGSSETPGEAIQLLPSDHRWSEIKRQEQPLPRYLGLYDDLEPMIVPPTGTKSAYYSSAGLRAQWRRAAEAMTHASSVTIIGYSFPPTDLAARHFFAGNLPKVPVTVVDRSSDAASTIHRLSAIRSAPVGFHGPNAVQEYVQRTCGDVLRWNADVDGSLLVPWMEVNGERKIGPPRQSWDEAYLSAGTLALQELASLDLNSSEFRSDDYAAHWPGLRLAYKFPSNSQHAP